MPTNLKKRTELVNNVVNKVWNKENVQLHIFREL